MWLKTFIIKNILLLILLQLLVQNISCNDILSTFHQSTYKIRDERIQLMRYNKSCFKSFEIKAFKYNRTTTAHNSTFSLKIDVHDKIEILIQCYKFLSNEFRHFPIRFQINLKKTVDSNAIGLGSIKNCGNVTSFYFYKNVTYNVCNFVIDDTCFPPLIPNGNYMVEITLLYSNVEIALVNIFGEVYIPIKYPKN